MSQHTEHHQEDRNIAGLAPTRLGTQGRYRSFVLAVGTEVEDRFEGRGVTVAEIARCVQDRLTSAMTDRVQRGRDTPEAIARSWPHFVIWENDRVRAVLVPERTGTIRVVRPGRHQAKGATP